MSERDCIKAEQKIVLEIKIYFFTRLTLQQSFVLRSICGTLFIRKTLRVTAKTAAALKSSLANCNLVPVSQSVHYFYRVLFF